MADMRQIGATIRYYREKQGMSQKALADRLLVSFQAISAWERGQSLPDLENCINLASFFGVSVDALLSAAGDELYIGVDGGGTKTEYVLFDKQGTVRMRMLSEGSNPNDLGVDRSVQVLTGCLDQMLAGKNVRMIFCGIGGAAVGDHREVMSRRLQERYHTAALVNTDAINLLSCSEKPQYTIAVISGTGMGVHIRKNGKLWRMGGWGYLFDQAGSAYDAGRDAIRLALAVHDNLVRPSPFSERIVKEIGGNPLTQLSDVYARGRAYIASLSRIVTEEAERGDPDALRILRDNAKYIASLLRTAVMQHGSGADVVAAGGFAQNDLFRSMIEEEAEMKLTLPDLPPIYGACIEAMRLDGVVADDCWRQKFHETYRRQTC